MRIPASGCAAVPLLKKKLTSDSTLALTPTAAEVGVRVTDAAAEGARVLSCPADVVVPLTARAGGLLTVVERRSFVRVGPACVADFDGPPAEELLDATDPFEPAEPVESADATAGIDAIAAPTPSATAEAPTQVNTLRLPGAARFGAAMPPNSAGSIRS
jgi:hypothetical protein